MNQKIFLFLLSTFVILFSSCKKEYDYVYVINDESVYQNSSTNENLKNSLEFISIVYTDLFGAGISQADIDIISTAYLAFGDKELVEEIIIKNLLNRQGVSMPSNASMRADVGAYVQNVYRKFYNRIPSEMEAWQLKNMINNDPNLTSEMVYFSFLTSKEYRYY